MRETREHMPSFEALRGRFPSLSGLRLSARVRRLPFVPQMELADCGAACLAMVLQWHGKGVTLREVRERVGCGRSGTSALALLEAARSYGLQGRGVRIEPEALRNLEPGTILHWGFEHFLVLQRVTRRGALVLDPADGPRLIPWDEMADRFTGVALVLWPAEGFLRGKLPGGSLRRYARRLLQHRRVLGHVLLHSLLLHTFALALPLLTGAIVDRIVPRGDVELLGALALGFGAMLGFHLLAGVVRALLLLRVQVLLDSRLGIAFVDHLSRLPYPFFLRRSCGDLLQRFESNRQVRETLTMRALTALLDGSLVVSYLAVLLWTSPRAGGLVLGIGALHVLLFLATRRRVRELTTRSLEVQARASSRLIDLLAGIETLKSMGAERGAVDRWSHVFVEELNVGIQRSRLQAWTDGLRGTLEIGGPLAILVLGGFQVLAGELSLGTMLALNALAAGFLAPLSQLIVTALELQQLRSHTARIDDVMDEPCEQEDDQVRAAPRLSGQISVDGVGFGYAEHEPAVLRDVTVDVRPGQKIAIVGRSGSGKSTLARLMVGLYRPTAGRVRYDGHDLAQLDLPSVRRQIGVVAQGAHLFGATVRANIALADPDATPQAIAAAARMAEIDAEIAAMPSGYDTVLAEGGATLSGGQRQRIAIARALLHEPSILVLDEATSELDTVSERRIMDRLAGMRCTRIVVAHRLSTIVDADVILVLDAGAVVESGTHAELLARGGLYSELVRAQTGAPRARACVAVDSVEVAVAGAT